MTRECLGGAIGEGGGIALSQAQRASREKFVIALTQERGYWKAPLTKWKRYNETCERIFAPRQREGRNFSVIGVFARDCQRKNISTATVVKIPRNRNKATTSRMPQDESGREAAASQVDFE